VEDVSERADPDPGDRAVGDDISSTWNAARERLRASVPDSTFRMWLEPLRATGAQGDTLYLAAPDGVRAWVERRYAGLIADALEASGAGLQRVAFTAPDATVGDASPSGLALNPNYTFDRFVIGEGNRVAHAAALAVAEAPSEAYNPLFLHGPPGLGKTHLLVAIGNYLRANAPQLSVRYTTAECFTNEFVTSLHGGGPEGFKHRYREVDVLLIDDVQFLEGKHHTEQEFFHTFNALYEAGSQIVLSADRMPSELSTLASRLRDRFEWGLTIRVEPPNLATRLTVLRRLVREAGVEIADREALAELAGRIDANLRQLHGGLTRVIAYASLMAKPLTSELIAEVIPRSRTAPRSDAEAIQLSVSATFDLSREDLVGQSRATTAVRARQVGIYLTRELTDLSLPQIGRLYGGRDHSTVLNSIRRIQARLASDPELAGQLQQLRGVLHKSGPGAA
jgi:chromosomal replication initiator protein